MTQELFEAIRSTKYPLNAFLFVQRGLDATVRAIHGQPKTKAPQTNRHITGKQLCHGLKDYAVKQYGLMARSVLRRWNINSCEDFGRIVFAMVHVGLLHKTENDSIQDFVGVFDFNEAFSPQLQLSENA